jgi:intermediate peptidase
MKVSTLIKINRKKFCYRDKRGLFGLAEFKSPKTIIDSTKNVIDRSRQIAHLIQKSSNDLKIIELMDKISNDCCTMIDGSTAVYHLHPDKHFKETSFESILQINNFFDEMNSNAKLYNILLELYFSDKVVSGLLFNTELNVFLQRNIEEISGFHKHNEDILTGSYSENVENLCAKLKSLNDFTEIFEISKINLDKTSSQSLKTIMKVASDRYRKEKNIPSDEVKEKEVFEADLNFCYTIVRKSNFKEDRDNAYNLISNAGKANSQKYVEILKERLKYAKSLGYKSFSHYQLQHQSLKINPDTLIEYIKKLWVDMRPNIIYDLSYLYKFIKQKNKETGQFSDIVSNKDNFIKNFEISNIQSAYLDSILSTIDEKTISKRYLTVQNLFTGLALLTKTVFNKELVPVLDEDLIKEDMLHESILMSFIQNEKQENIAKVFFDLFVRDGKFRDIFSQFTVKGSKELNLFERNFRQMPVSIIASNFEVTDRNLLNMPIGFNDAKSIFHEFGHTLHSVLSKTDFQALSGNRIPLDFAEIPSHFMEYFLYDYNFSKQWMIDQDSKETISEQIFSIFTLQGRFFANFDLEETLYYTLFDLMIHNNEDESKISDQFLVDTHFHIISNYTVSHQINFSNNFFSDFSETMKKYKDKINPKYPVDTFLGNLIKDLKPENNEINNNFVQEINNLIAKHKNNQWEILKERNEEIFMDDHSFLLSPHFKNYPSMYYTYIIGKVFANLIWTNGFYGKNYQKSGRVLEECFLNKGFTENPKRLLADFFQEVQRNKV